MKFVKVKGFEKKVAFLGVFYMCVFGESNLTVYNKCLEDLFQQKLSNLIIFPVPTFHQVSPQRSLLFRWANIRGGCQPPSSRRVS